MKRRCGLCVRTIRCLCCRDVANVQGQMENVGRPGGLLGVFNRSSCLRLCHACSPRLLSFPCVRFSAAMFSSPAWARTLYLFHFCAPNAGSSHLSTSEIGSSRQPVVILSLLPRFLPKGNGFGGLAHSHTVNKRGNERRTKRQAPRPLFITALVLCIIFFPLLL